MSRVIFFDLEYASDHGTKERNWQGAGEYRELTQIGAIAVDTTRMAVRERFHTMVRPLFTGLPSAYHLALTKTKTRDYENAPNALHALADFLRFTNGSRAFCYGQDGLVLFENACLYRMDGFAHNARGRFLRGTLRKDAACQTRDREILMAFYGAQAEIAHRLSGGEYHLAFANLNNPQTAHTLRVIDILPWLHEGGVDTRKSSGELAGLFNLTIPRKDMSHHPVWDATSVFLTSRHLIQKGHRNFFADTQRHIRTVQSFRPIGKPAANVDVPPRPKGL